MGLIRGIHGGGSSSSSSSRATKSDPEPTDDVGPTAEELHDVFVDTMLEFIGTNLAPDGAAPLWPAGLTGRQAEAKVWQVLAAPVALGLAVDRQRLAAKM